MKKVSFLNFDCGGGVEYAGNIIAEWIKELDVDFKEYKIQNPACLVINELIAFKPDIVLFNDRPSRLYEAAYYYKRFNPKTKSIYFSHSVKEICPPTTKNNNEKREDEVLFYIFMRDYIDKVVCFGDKNRGKDFIIPKLLGGCFPINPNVYYPKVKWVDRKKLFCYVGQINKLKFSEDFIRLMKRNPDIEIDMYGVINETGFLEQDCVDFLKTHKNYFGPKPQEDIPDILNQYKYLVIPHGRMPEIFHITLLQAINCGTIPILMNDCEAQFDYTWADWATEFIIPCNKELELLTILRNLMKDESDYTYMSDKISKRSQEKFSYDKFKEEFQALLKGWL